MVDLELGYKNLGREQTFFLTMTDKSNYVIYGEHGNRSSVNNKGVVDVHSIDYVIGERLSLTLGYFPENSSDNKAAFEKFCSFRKVPMCDFIDSPFGLKSFLPKDFNPDLMPNGVIFSTYDVVVVNFSRNLNYSKM